MVSLIPRKAGHTAARRPCRHPLRHAGRVKPIILSALALLAWPLMMLFYQPAPGSELLLVLLAIGGAALFFAYRYRQHLMPRSRKVVVVVQAAVGIAIVWPAWWYFFFFRYFSLFQKDCNEGVDDLRVELLAPFGFQDFD